MSRLIYDINDEINKCIQSPYYFAITYLQVKRPDGKLRKYTTMLSEQEFNDYFNNQIDEDLNIVYKEEV